MLNMIDQCVRYMAWIKHYASKLVYLHRWFPLPDIWFPNFRKCDFIAQEYSYSCYPSLQVVLVLPTYKGHFYQIKCSQIKVATQNPSVVKHKKTPYQILMMWGLRYFVNLMPFCLALYRHNKTTGSRAWWDKRHLRGRAVPSSSLPCVFLEQLSEPVVLVMREEPYEKEGPFLYCFPLRRMQDR